MPTFTPRLHTRVRLPTRSERGRLYHHVRNLLADDSFQELLQAYDRYEKAKQRREELYQNASLTFVRNHCRVLGMTTTGVAKQQVRRALHVPGILSRRDWLIVICTVADRPPTHRALCFMGPDEVSLQRHIPVLIVEQQRKSRV